METPSGHDLSAIDAAPLGGYQIAIVVICFVVAMVDGFDTQAIAMVAPDIAKAWDTPIAAFGPVFGAGLLGGMLGGFVAGDLADRFGRKPSLIASMLIFGIGSLVTPVAASLNEMMLMRFITGLGLGGALPSFVALTAEFTPRRMRATLVSAMYCGFPFGASIGAVASAWALPRYGWQSLFVAGGLIPLGMLPVVIFMLPESLGFLHARNRIASITRIAKRLGLRNDQLGDGRNLHDERPRDVLLGVGGLFRSGRASGTLLLWVTFFLSLLVSLLLVNWLPSVTRSAGLATEGAVGVVAVLNIGSIVGCMVLSRFIERLGPYVVIGAGYTIGAFAVMAIGWAGASVAAVFTSVFIAGFFSVGAQLCVVALAAVYYPSEIRATGVGWTMGIGRIGAVVGPIVGGLLAGSEGSSLGLFAFAALSSVLAAATVALMGALERKSRKSRQAFDISGAFSSAKDR